MKQSYWITLSLTLSLVSCHPSKPLSTNANNCVAVVQNYLGITDPIAVTNSVEQPSLQLVDIKYQSQNDENIPISGNATCLFAAPDVGKNRLLEATINNQTLTKEDIAALNQQVKFSQ